ncbi:MAG: helicase-exonuclease AddAB subunit AddA [Firmicutes bacterium]|nr:helicase-exonuclease AddAB subunit AddA [Bacillota bacterium]
MSRPDWTDEQWAAISAPRGNLLVSAAAGAGKTAVLVERIIRQIVTSSALDIDQLLVVTFTEAAATEMRQRIGAALAQALSDRPGDDHLLRQLALLNRADISTIHSFCLKIIRRYFYLLDLDPAFRVTDETEAGLILREVLDDLWEDMYADQGAAGKAFVSLINYYSAGRDDEKLKEIIITIYNLSRSQPWPEQWLKEIGHRFRVPAAASLTDLPWAQPLRDYAVAVLTAAEDALQEAVYYTSLANGPAKYEPCLRQEIEAVANLAASARAGSWEELREALNYSFPRLTPIRKADQVDPDLQTWCTSARNRAKKIIAGLKQDVFVRPERDLVSELERVAPAMTTVVGLVLELGRRFEAAKRARGRVDFADLEHYALRILRAPESRYGQDLPSAAAHQLKQEYEEIFVDEYQDINPVQDAILNLVSRQDKEPNLFLVGDVKQSIYGFRLAEPRLFLEKYLSYSAAAGDKERKIALTANFRSRPAVLEGVNFLFRQLLTPQLGGLDYDREAELRAGAKYPPLPAGTAGASHKLEVHLLERQSGSGEKKTADFLPGTAIGLDDLTALEKEALVIGHRIQAMVHGTGGQPEPEFMVWDQKSKCYRPVTYRDIVILMRTVHKRANSVLEVLQQLDIPVYADLGTGYFAAPEIRVMVSVLKIIENPRQDIPLAAVLRSPLVGLTAAELAEIRLTAPEGDFYEAVRTAAAGGVSTSGRQKLNQFLNQLQLWRTAARQRSLGDLIWQVYRDTDYLTYVAALPGGDQRQANLRALYDRACQFETYGRPGLSRFMRFLERLQAAEGDFGPARALGENENVVRLMSIHKSKGLEFPVVFVADLGKQFNFDDLKGEILLHKDMGLGPMVVDMKLGVKYPSLAHRAVQLAAREDILAEELRILYVALTRAREKLILVGSATDLAQQSRIWSGAARQKQKALPQGSLMQARTYLDWLGPALACHQDAYLLRPNQGHYPGVKTDPSAWQVCLYRSEEELRPILAQIEAGRELSLDFPEPKEPPPPEVAVAVEKALGWRYLYEDAVSLAAKVTVSELKGRLVEVEPEVSRNWPQTFPPLSQRPRFIGGKTTLTAMEHGSAVHLILEHLDLTRSLTATDIQQQIERLVAKEFLTEDQAETVDARALAAFFASPLGRRLTARPESVRREMPFSLVLPARAVYPAAELSPATSAEPVLVQGIIDCAVKEDCGWLLLDFKTDRVQGAALERRLEGYKTQIRLYACAFQHLSPLPVTEAYLYFLTTAIEVPVPLNS